MFLTGNRINNGRNILDDLLKIFKYIKIIHLKDKNDKNKNVKFEKEMLILKNFQNFD